MQFIIAKNKEQFPIDKKPEIAIIGRSNIGKSTLINTLTKTNLAAISKKPGKTKTLNFHETKHFYIVDMPGYGFSEQHDEINFKSEKLITEYLSSREQLIGLIHICSILGLNELDIDAKNFFSSKYDNYLLLLNKIDKFGKMQQTIKIKKIIKDINIDENKIIPISAKNNENINVIFSKINSWIKELKK